LYNQFDGCGLHSESQILTLAFVASLQDYLFDSELPQGYRIEPVARTKFMAIVALVNQMSGR
jgi:hypothetical protein